MRGLSTNSKYYIPEHRYYELLHFCRQYNDYLIEKRELLDTYVKPIVHTNIKCDATAENRTEHWAIKLADIDDKIQMIEQATIDADESLSSYILMAVTSGLSYDTMNARYNVPCSRNTFYDRFRKFFWILNQRRR